MIPRRLASVLQQRLEQFPAVALLGPRQVGKTTLARARSPKVYIRDSGLVHVLLRLPDREALLGHPVVGGSWEGFVLENLIGCAPDGTQASFYRTAAGAEIDLVLELPNSETWAIEIKRGLAPSPDRGFHHALADLTPNQAWMLHGGEDRYGKPGGITVIGLRELCAAIQSCA